MASKDKTAVQAAKEFCKAWLGKYCFGPFTGQDWSAWHAFVYAVELYGRGDADGRRGAIVAMRALLASAQRGATIEQIFIQTIPAILDWSHVNEIWPQLGATSGVTVVNDARVH
jgi:hypothetical protein